DFLLGRPLAVLICNWHPAFAGTTIPLVSPSPEGRVRGNQRVSWLLSFPRKRESSSKKLRSEPLLKSFLEINDMPELVTNVWLWLLLLLVVAVTLAYRGAPRLVWTAALGIVMAAFYVWAAAPWLPKIFLLAVYLLPALLFNIPV